MHDALPCLRQRAALRKLRHELGIAPEALSARGFRFLTRLHYCAPDHGTYGPTAEWGEHEVRSCCEMKRLQSKVLLGGANRRRMLRAGYAASQLSLLLLAFSFHKKSECLFGLWRFGDDGAAGCL